MVVQKLSSTQLQTFMMDPTQTRVARRNDLWQTQTYNPPLQRKVRRTCCLEFINWRLTTLHHPPVAVHCQTPLSSLCQAQ